MPLFCFSLYFFTYLLLWPPLFAVCLEQSGGNAGCRIFFLLLLLLLWDSNSISGNLFKYIHIQCLCTVAMGDAAVWWCVIFGKELEKFCFSCSANQSHHHLSFLLGFHSLTEPHKRRLVHHLLLFACCCQTFFTSTETAEIPYDLLFFCFW